MEMPCTQLAIEEWISDERKKIGTCTSFTHVFGALEMDDTALGEIMQCMRRRSRLELWVITQTNVHVEEDGPKKRRSGRTGATRQKRKQPGQQEANEAGEECPKFLQT